MAEAVVGATIELLLENLLSLAKEEIGLFWNFNTDLEKLKESVVTIRELLEDAEKKQLNDNLVKRWLKKLEAVAFDADYVFDELNYHVLRKKVQRDKKMKKKTLQATKDGGESHLRKLPKTFKYLISLHHLDIPNIKLPPEMGKLISLQCLPYFQVGDEEGCGIMELGCLKNLGGEIEIHNLEKVGDRDEARSANLFHKPNIVKLKLVWNESREVERASRDEKVLEGLQPHSNLKRLEINGFQGRSFPLWTLRMEVRDDLESRWVRLDNLLEIKLSDCKECDEMPMLGQLPHLKSLFLHQLSNVKCLGSSFYGIEEKGKVVVFPVLKKLEMIGMANLIAWDEVELASSSESQPRQVSVFPCLEYLKIIDCRKLMSAPSNFPCLKELEICNMESELALASC